MSEESKAAGSSSSLDVSKKPFAEPAVPAVPELVSRQAAEPEASPPRPSRSPDDKVEKVDSVWNEDNPLWPADEPAKKTRRSTNSQAEVSMDAPAANEQDVGNKVSASEPSLDVSGADSSSNSMESSSSRKESNSAKKESNSARKESNPGSQESDAARKESNPGSKESESMSSPISAASPDKDGLSTDTSSSGTQKQGMAKRQSGIHTSLSAFNYVNSLAKDDDVRIRDSDRLTSLFLVVAIVLTAVALFTPQLAPHRFGFVVVCDALVGCMLLLYVVNRFGILNTLNPRQALLTWQLIVGGAFLGMFLTINVGAAIAFYIAGHPMP